MGWNQKDVAEEGCAWLHETVERENFHGRQDVLVLRLHVPSAWP